MKKEEKPTPIELRSDKVRHILGSIPHGFVYWGTSIIVVIFAILIAAVLRLPYPYGKGETIFDHLVG